MNEPIIIEGIEQGSDEWHAIKAGVASSSRFNAIQAKGKSGAESLTRKQYLIQLATERITGMPADETPNMPWMKHGTEKEDSARAAYELQTGNSVRQITFCYLNEHKRIGSSTDGLVGDDGMIEIKCGKLATHVGYIIDNRLPPAYVAQVQGTLWVTGRKWCDFITYNEMSHVELFIVRVLRDDEYIDKLGDAVSVFLTDLEMLEMKLRKITT